MLKSDEIRLKHMLEAAREAMSFTARKTRANLEEDKMLALALIREIEVIGEAASKVSEETKQQNPQIAWGNIVATRNRLIHAYFEVDLDIVWQTVVCELPTLAETPGKLVALPQ
jgi:uncharacterized protein with HEPN domain